MSVATLLHALCKKAYVSPSAFGPTNWQQGGGQINMQALPTPQFQQQFGGQPAGSVDPNTPNRPAPSSAPAPSPLAQQAWQQPVHQQAQQHVQQAQYVPSRPQPSYADPRTGAARVAYSGGREAYVHPAVAAERARRAAQDSIPGGPSLQEGWERERQRQAAYQAAQQRYLTMQDLEQAAHGHQVSQAARWGIRPDGRQLTRADLQDPRNFTEPVTAQNYQQQGWHERGAPVRRPHYGFAHR